MAPPLPLALLAEKVEVVTLRVPVPLASPLLIAPPVPALAALPENVEPATVRDPVPPLSPLSMAPPLWAPVLFAEKVELVTVAVPLPALSPLFMAPPSPLAESPGKSRSTDGQGASPAAVAVVDRAAVAADAITSEGGPVNAKGAGAGGVPAVDGTAPVSRIGGKGGAGSR